MDIKVLGPGCKKCQKLEKLTKEALKELSFPIEVEKISDVNRFIDYGVMITPALVVNGNLKVSGRLPGKDEIITWLQEESS